MCTTVEKKNTEAYEGVYTQGCIIKNMHVTRTEGNMNSVSVFVCIVIYCYYSGLSSYKLLLTAFPFCSATSLTICDVAGCSDAL